jgi:predicted nucleic acid-binding protein
VKLLVAEPGTEDAQAAYESAEGVRTTAIAHVETVAALARMKKGKRLTAAQLRTGLEDLEKLWRGLYVHGVNDALLAQAAETAVGHSLRAYDAVHLAGALSFREGEDLEFACWDKELRQAASQHGFTLIPAQLG